MATLPYQLVRRHELDRLTERIRNLESQIASARNFIREIENGNLAIEFDEQSSSGKSEDVLASSLISMRDQMRKIAEEEKQRTWVTEGLARFVEILRSGNNDLQELSHVILSNIARYMKANQGSLLMINDSDPSDVHLELIACYAYDRRKHIEKRVALGDGLAGQCVLEKSTLYLTNLPQDYLKITSGLGEALPRNLLVVPLLLDDQVYGVIELASFNTFEPHHRMFIEKLAESIASTVSNVRINEQTRNLLHETQQQAEQVRSQEEEMRQNMEELSATQEEMQRILREVEAKEAYVTQLLNVSNDAIFTIDNSYRLVSWNKALAYLLEKSGLRAEKGMNILDWYSTAERAEQSGVFDRVLKGESFDLTTTKEDGDKTIHNLSVYAPLRNEKGMVYEAAVFIKDVTAMMQTQKQAERLQYEAQSKAEELKAQEEELRQNLEELSAQQEEMERILRQVEAKESYLSQLLNVSSDSIYTIDRNYKLVGWNDTFAAALEKLGRQPVKGTYTPGWYSEAERQMYIELYDRALNGEVFEHAAVTDQQGRSVHQLTLYAPLKDERGSVIEAAIFSKDVTAMMEAKASAEKLSYEAQEQTEQLRAQEEEMKQSMEELAATQDEMERIISEHKHRLFCAKLILDAADDMVCTIDHEYRFVSWNRSFEESEIRNGRVPEIGKSLLEWYPEGNTRKEQVKLLNRVFKGESFHHSFSTGHNGHTKSFLSNYKPLVDDRGEVFQAVVFTRNLAPGLITDPGVPIN